MNEEQEKSKQVANRTVAVSCAAFVCGMVGMAYAAVPLYELFCQITGFGGTTQRADVAPETVIDREITIRFDANTANGLNWDFEPEVRQVTLKIGETGQVNYIVENMAELASAGVSSFNVSPPSAGAYFNKMQCFCFTEQVLASGETQEMPVIFFVDPEFVNDQDTAKHNTITLSYTFFPTEVDEEQLAQLNGNTPENL